MKKFLLLPIISILFASCSVVSQPPSESLNPPLNDSALPIMMENNPLEAGNNNLEESSQMDTPETEPITSIPECLVMAAKDDLSKQFQIELKTIQTLQTEPTNWPDESLGCPQPGETYAQVITPGYQIILRVGDRLFYYHTDTDETVVFCTTSNVNSGKEDISVQDGWPNQTKDKDVIVITPTPSK